MTLYSYWRSTTSYRVRAVLNLKGLAYEIRPVNLLAGDQRSAGFAALNPSQGVPVLVLDDGTVLTQSLSIIDYLDQIAPSPPILPADPLSRAEVMAAAYCTAVDIHPVNNLRVVDYLKSRHDTPPEDIIAWMRHWIEDGFAALEARLPEREGLSFGETPDLCDICLVAQLYNARRWEVDLAPFAKIRRVEAACLAHPAIEAARPENQPDAESLT